MKFSIITVVKNDKINIESTINSVFLQNFSDYEHIIIDGNSSDGTSKIIKRTIRNRKKVIYIRRKDKNLYQALNRGIKVSKGDFVGILHSGDMYFNNKVLDLVNSKISNKIDILSGFLIYVDNNLKKKRFWNYKIKDINLYNTFKIAHPTTFINKKVFKKIGYYDILYNIASDTDFLLRVSKIPNITFMLLQKTLIVMKIGGLSTSYSRIFRKIYEDLNIYFFYFNILFLALYIKKILYKIRIN
ncbi:glycosyltransferase [Candidatus Pelagibacter sp.]|nr:glycosyltransferase [Candidatus Pelagibacter sp.]